MLDIQAMVLFNRRVARDTYLMGLEVPEIIQTSRPGQFIMLGVGDGQDPLLRRPFSICGRHGEDGLLVLYRVVGRGTALLSRAPAGRRLDCLGPLGNGFRLPRPGTILLAVGGGMGAAPLLFLLQSLAQHQTAELMLGFRTSTEILPSSELPHLPEGAAIATDDGSRGRHGLVTQLLAERLQRHTAPDEDFVICACGPRPMLQEVAALANDRRIPCQVSLEAHMACGVGACQGCAVAADPGMGRPYLHVCREGPVFEAEAVLWGSL